MTKNEAVARTLCRLDGYGTDVDDKGRPMWMNYRDHARQVIEAIEAVDAVDPVDAFERSMGGR